MNAAAYLTNHGWRGDGHALHHSGRGITKPISVSKKTNVLGIGKKKHDAHADQWWARAFDETLKGLNTSENVATGKIEGVAMGTSVPLLQLVQRGGSKWVGQKTLYSNFVKGETLGATLVSDQDNVAANLPVDVLAETHEERSRDKPTRNPAKAQQSKKQANHQNPENDPIAGVGDKAQNGASLARDPVKIKAHDPPVSPGEHETKHERRMRRQKRKEKRLRESSFMDQELPDERNMVEESSKIRKKRIKHGAT